MKREELIKALSYYMDPGAFPAILSYTTEELVILLAWYHTTYNVTTKTA